MTQRKIQYWVIPPESNGEFVANMEDVLETYSLPYDPKRPVLCMDEQPVQLHKDVKSPIEGTKTRPRRVDYEYERAGVASIFMFNEPLSGWRSAHVRERRTKIDWAIEVGEILSTRYADVEQVVLVCDNLNTHTKGAFYEAFPPEKARQLVKKIIFCYTPKHGSWLNIAENELSSMTRQCLARRRLESIDVLRRELDAWTKNTNAKQRTVDWQFKISDARTKLKSLYPKS